MYYPERSPEFKYYIEIEVHHELLLSPLLTQNPDEADFFYIPIYPFAVHHKTPGFLINDLFNELRRIGPWFDRKNGSDHIITCGYDFDWFGGNFTRDFLKTDIIFCGLYPVFGGDSWKIYEYKRFITVPHISYSERYPFEMVDWKRKRKNKAFVAQTYSTPASGLRRKVAKAVKRVKNHDIVLFRRSKKSFLNNVPDLPIHYMDAEFCICPRGDNPIAKRNFDAPHYGCIPVYISDDLVLPFAGTFLDYSKFSIRIPERDVNKLPKILESFSDEDILRLRKELRKCADLYRFRLGQAPRIGEGFWAISWMWYIRYQYTLQFDFKYYSPSWNVKK